MKIIMKYILNNVRERKLRTTVMLLSIMLSAALLFVSLAIGDSYNSAQQKMAKGFAGAAAISVSSKPDASGNMIWINESEIPELKSIKSKVGLITVSALFNENDYFENIDLIGADLKELNTINKPRLVDGSELKDFNGYSIVIQEKFTSKYGIKPGDTIALSIGGVRYEFKLAAIAAYDTVFLRQTRGFNALIPKDTLSKILNTASGSSRILIEPAVGISSDELKTELDSILPQEQYTVAKVYDEKEVAASAKDKALPSYLISFFSLVMSVFIIFSSYKVITIERLPVIGTFRSIGATQKTTSRILVIESLVYGVVGGALGIPLGFLILKLILNGLGNSLSLGIEIPMVVSSINLVLSFFVAIAVSLISSLIPIRRASMLPLKEVVLGTVEEKNTSNKRKLCFGAMLLVISVVLPKITGKENSNLLLVAGGISLLGVIVSTIILIPLITNTSSSLLERIYEKLLVNEGKLAARNMRQNKNVNQNITLLTVSLSAVIVISMITSFVNVYVGDVFRGGALSGFVSAEMSPELVDEIKSIDGVKEALPIYELDNKISGDSTTFVRMEATDDLNLLCSMLNIEFTSADNKENIQSIFNKDRNILLSRDSLKQRGLKVGDSISLSYNNQTYAYKIIGSFVSRSDNSEAIIPGTYAKSDFGEVNYGMLTFISDNPEAAIVQIRNLFGNKYNWSRTIEEFKKDALGIINAFLQPMKKLTYFILLLAAIGVINNLIINYIQKKRSIAMYKSVGLGNRQNVKMSIIEGFTSGLIGSAVGMFLASIEIKAIFLVAGPRISVVPKFDGILFLAVGAAGILITLIGSVVPILKGSQMNIIEEIKFE